MREMLRFAWIGMGLHCPACGRGFTSTGLLRMEASCSVCGAVFEREEGDFLGSMVVAYSVTAVLVAVGVFAVEAATDLGATAHIILWSGAAGAFLLLTYRHMRGIWLGILHAMSGLKGRN